MSDESSKTPLGRMSRRKMLGTRPRCSEESSPASRETRWGRRDRTRRRDRRSAAAAGPNLAPPVVQTKCGKLRGLREGKTLSFLGIRYAEAERFGLPKPVQPWEGIKNAQVWGPVCPAPEQTTVSSDELVFPHRYWIANEHCQYLNVWTPEPHPGGEEAGHGLDARRRLHQRLVDGVVRLRRAHAQRVRRRRGGQHEPPPEHPRHARSVGLRSAVRELALHGHGRSGDGAAVGAGEHRGLRRRSATT